MSDAAAESRQRLAAILAADAAGYSRLMARDESATIASLDAARHIFHTAIGSHRGRVIDMAGDSVLAVFDTAASAVSAALQVQEALEVSTARVPTDRRLRFRIGVHMGDITEKADGSVYGDGVNIAARLEGLALPGGITVSDAVYGSVRNRVAGSFEDLGEQQVKNIADPVRVFRVVPKVPGAADHASTPAQLLASASLLTRRWRWWWWGPPVGLVLIGAAAMLAASSHRSTSVAGPPLLSIAVLPFKPSDAAESVALAHAFSEGLTRRLAQTVAGRSVVSPAAVQAYRGDLNDASAVGKALNVRYLAQGDI
ncbi:MAG: adenylate/guanylate cyclase domain-containing protein, partial [Caldimonas sp.]